MIKLYLRENGRITRYHEAWDDDDCITEHWGALGAKGKTREHLRVPGIAASTMIRRLLADARVAGYKAVSAARYKTLLIQYAVRGMGSKADLKKRHALQDRMDGTLGWTGLGHCDGGSIGGGTMEVCCYVVDFEVARRVIMKDLSGTEFADYTRILDEDAD